MRLLHTKIPTHTIPHSGVVHITCQAAEETPSPLAPQTRVMLVGPHQPTLEMLHQIATDPYPTHSNPLRFPAC